MNLSNKVLLFMVFVASTIFIVFVWFAIRFHNHTTQFRAAFAEKKQTMEAELNAGLEDFNKKAESFHNEVSDHFEKMKEDLTETK